MAKCKYCGFEGTAPEVLNHLHRMVEVPIRAHRDLGEEAIEGTEREGETFWKEEGWDEEVGDYVC